MTSADVRAVSAVRGTPSGLEAAVSAVRRTELRDALAHLHDLPYLQTHPLAAGLAVGRSSTAGRALHARLVEAIEALRPPNGADPRSHAWRGYRILRLRYVEALDVGAVRGELERALALPGAAEAVPACIRALTTLGHLTRRQAEFPAARAHFEEALALADRQGDRLERGMQLYLLGHVLSEQGERGRADDLLRESLRIADELRLPQLKSLASFVVGHNALTDGDLAEAERRFGEGLAAADEADFPHGRGLCGRGLGRVAFERGQLDRAAAALPPTPLVAWHDGCVTWGTGTPAATGLPGPTENLWRGSPEWARSTSTRVGAATATTAGWAPAWCSASCLRWRSPRCSPGASCSTVSAAA